VIATLAREGGFESTLWAGPETLSRRMKSRSTGDADCNAIELDKALGESVIRAAGSPAEPSWKWPER